jgi:hypothetical protein
VWPKARLAGEPARAYSGAVSELTEVQEMAQNGSAPNKLALAVGVGIGISWVAMALYMLVHAFSGISDSRPDYGLAWGLAGVLLLAAGVASLIGTWWHVLRAPTAEH